jgi:hypothetical protein
MGYEVVISNSKLNRYGFRVITAGIDIEQYKKNSILLFMHTRAWRETRETVLPIGTVNNLRIVGDDLLGTLNFDCTDEFSKSIKAKWDAGTLKMVSPGLDPIEQSEDPELLVPGQRYATVTKSRLDEISVVDIGANDDAIALYKDGQLITLSDNGDNNFLNPIKPKTETQILNNNMKSIALKLGLPETATEDQILEKIGQIQLVAGKATDMEKELNTQKDVAIIQLVDGAIREKRITADKKDHFVGLGKAVGADQLKSTLDLMSPVVKAIDLIHQAGGAAAEVKKWGEYTAEERITLRAENKETYIKLYQAEYGCNPTIYAIGK